MISTKFQIISGLSSIFSNKFNSSFLSIKIFFLLISKLQNLNDSVDAWPVQQLKLQQNNNTNNNIRNEKKIKQYHKCLLIFCDICLEHIGLPEKATASWNLNVLWPSENQIWRIYYFIPVNIHILSNTKQINFKYFNW